MKLYYKEFCLGNLTYSDGKYFYSSSSEEKLALERYSALIEYNLEGSKNVESNILFPFFKNKFIDEIIVRKDILEKIGTKSADDFEILEKFCKLNFDKFGYYLKSE